MVSRPTAAHVSKAAVSPSIPPIALRRPARRPSRWTATWRSRSPWATTASSRGSGIAGSSTQPGRFCARRSATVRKCALCAVPPEPGSWTTTRSSCGTAARSRAIRSASRSTSMPKAMTATVPLDGNGAVQGGGRYRRKPDQRPDSVRFAQRPGGVHDLSRRASRRQQHADGGRAVRRPAIHSRKRLFRTACVVVLLLLRYRRRASRTMATLFPQTATR